MKKSILVLVISLVLAACSKDQSVSPVSNDETTTALTEKATPTRPMMVNFYATPDMTAPPVECLPAGSTVFVGGGMIIHGTATHVGLVNPANSYGTVVHCNLGPLPYQLTTQHTGQIAAANGDLMFFSSNEVTSVLDGSMSGVVTMTGGTGRFANATGSVNIVGAFNFQTGNSQWTGTGTITY